MPGQDGIGEGDLRTSLAVLTRRRWTIVFTTVLAGIVALAASFAQEKIYEGEAQVLLGDSQVGASVDLPAEVGGSPRRSVQTEIQLLESVPVRQLVRDELKVAVVPDVKAEPIGQSDVIELRSRSESPQRAADVANAYARAYISFRRQREVDRLKNSAEELKTQVSSLQAQVADLDGRIAEANPAAAGDLKTQRDIVLQQQIGLTQRLALVQAQATLDVGGAQLVAPATVPTSPVSPRPLRNAALALALGLALGVGLAVAREHLDDRISGDHDLTDAGPDAPVVGTVPKIVAWKDRDEPLLVTVTEPYSPAAEAYRSLAASLGATGLGDSIRTLQVTSPTAAQGKTVTAANLSLVLAESGRQVITVCCDLRRARLHRFFGLPNSPGLSDWVHDPTNPVLQTVPGVPGLRFLASGSKGERDAGLMGGRRIPQLLRALDGLADVVIVDSPPLLGVSDAAVLGAKVDSNLLVTMAGATTRRQLDGAVEQLRRVKAPLLGVVLNGVTAEHGYYGYAYQGHLPHEAVEEGR